MSGAPSTTPRGADPRAASPGTGHDAAVAGMFGRIVPFYDLLNRVLSLGLDVYWRRVLARNVRLGQTGLVLDLAAGT